MNLDRFDLVVPGQPIPLARARRGAGGRFYLPKRSVEFRQRVQAAWMLAGRPSLGSELFSLSARFYRSTRQPADLDNCVKAVCDALNTLAWLDDSQLVCLSGVHKIGCGRGEERTELTVWVASGMPA